LIAKADNWFTTGASERSFARYLLKDGTLAFVLLEYAPAATPGIAIRVVAGNLWSFNRTSSVFSSRKWLASRRSLLLAKLEAVAGFEPLDLNLPLLPRSVQNSGPESLNN
jgi:hypothetical protein